MEKKHILVVADHPFSPSGVGSQTRYVIEALIKTGEYRFTCIGGAIKHLDYEPQQHPVWGSDWVVYPVDGYGNPDMIRSLIRSERPMMLWFMTDPRFFGWLWEIEDEIRPLIPMVYYHVWDNYPYPDFNAPFYESNDMIACISKVTHDIVQTLCPDVDSAYVPHAVPNDVFKKLDSSAVEEFRKSVIDSDDDEEEKMIFFWNNRNARRKQSGSIIFWFREFLDKVGHDKAMLLMHTDPKDENGQDLEAILKGLDLINGEVRFSNQKVEPEHLALMYNAADCTINIADAEGFGLSTLESLSCETPIIVNMTGGLQEQVTDGEEWFGIGIEPCSKAIIGSQNIPYIYEDRVSKDMFIEALVKMYEMPEKDRAAMGALGRQHVLKNYGFKLFETRWVDLIETVIEKHGSWETRKGYDTWEIKEVI